MGWAFVVSFPDSLFQCGFGVLNWEGVVFKCKSPHFASCLKDGYFESMLCLAWRNSVLAKPCTGWVVCGVLVVLKLCGTC